MASLADSLRNRKACYGSSETQMQNRPMENTDASIIFLSLDWPNVTELRVILALEQATGKKVGKRFSLSSNHWPPQHIA